MFEWNNQEYCELKSEYNSTTNECPNRSKAIFNRTTRMYQCDCKTKISSLTFMQDSERTCSLVPKLLVSKTLSAVNVHQDSILFGEPTKKFVSITVMMRESLENVLVVTLGAILYPRLPTSSKLIVVDASTELFENGSMKG
ncbi:hypothetical protein QR98_0060390 [Sarcoptes scabiei]|uniref:Uncharacterized protein n=1 Tax=Sarcoptes scabiei TaxID=52283 RepID=A0A132A9B3_SARSC|nr:hypothetical protein QR98_0060390 [Sarcoptes scabiei]